MKRLTKQNKIIVGVISLMLVLTVGYALFSETLNIKGTAKASGEFNIIFSEVGTPTGKEASITPEPQITNNGKTLNITGVKLDMPTAYLNVPAVIENTGSIDAKVKGIDITGLDDPDIEVSYSGVHQDQILKSKDTVPITIRIEWKKESTVTSKNLSFTIGINYEQVTGQEITNPPKDTYAVGDEFCLDTECFYTVSDNGDTVTALAKYNLLVGNKVVLNDTMDNVESITPISEDEERYGLQSEKAKAAEKNKKEMYGAIAFSDTNYWYNNGLKPEYGTGYPANVFNKNSKIYPIVKNYENHLRKKLGYDSVKVSLMTYDQFVDLGCQPKKYECTTNAPNWVYSSSYWGASVRNIAFVWYVYSYGTFGGYRYDSNKQGGVRPVITISKSEL